MSGYLETVIRQARGGSAELRLRPRSRFEGIAPGFEIEEMPAAELGSGSVLATAPSKAEPSLPGRAADEAPFAGSASPPDAPAPRSARTVAASSETVHAVQRIEHATRTDRIEERRETRVRDHTVERHGERGEIAASEGRAEPVGAPLAANVTAPRAIATQVQERASSPPTSPPPARRSRETTRRSFPPSAGPPPGIALRYEAARETAPEVTVVIGRLDVQMVRDASADPAGVRAAAPPAANSAAPALSDYLLTRTAK